jgi:hypothetical protein
VRGPELKPQYHQKKKKGKEYEEKREKSKRKTSAYKIKKNA